MLPIGDEATHIKEHSWNRAALTHINFHHFYPSLILLRRKVRVDVTHVPLSYRLFLSAP
jgi:hypothetical protein